MNVRYKTDALLSCSVIAAFLLWAALAMCNSCGQRRLVDSGILLSDFWMPKMCLEEGYASNGHSASGWVDVTAEKKKYITGDDDKVYPAFALMPFAVFPATWAGAWTWACLAPLVFVLSLLFAARDQALRRQRIWVVLACFLSGPFVFSVERGNPIWLAAAAVTVFLNWWDDPRPRQRYAAAVCLAVAAAFKLAPAVLGVLYLPKMFSKCEQHWRPAVVSFIAFVVLFFVPWVFVPDGLGGISIMLHNAACHQARNSIFTDFGLVPLFRVGYRLITGQLLGVGALLSGADLLTKVFGVFVLAIGAKRGDRLLAVAGMLYLAGNMFYYGALYVMPCIVVCGGLLGRTWCDGFGNSPWRLRARIVDFALTFFFLCPLQFIVMEMSVTRYLCNGALLLAVMIRLWSSWLKRGK